MAAACAPDLETRLEQALAGFVDPIGLAFQIQDDLLDVLSDTATLGKAAGADRERGKPTYPAILGVNASQEQVRRLHAQAMESLAPFGARADALRGVTDWLWPGAIDRRREAVEPDSGMSDEAYQDEILPHVSRTFALTIPQLPPALRTRSPTPTCCAGSRTRSRMRSTLSAATPRSSSSASSPS